jgi:hypothetical protein
VLPAFLFPAPPCLARDLTTNARDPNL